MMDWIKVLNKHILFEYNDLRDSEFAAWIKIMALTAQLEHEPTREQILKYVNYQTLDSLCKKLHSHSIDLPSILHKVLMDVSYVAHRREALKLNTQRYRERNKPVIDDVMITSQIREDKIREDNKKNIKREKISFVLPDFIKPDTWDAFKEMRQRKRAPLTDRAAALIVKELIKLRSAGNNPEDVLNQSIMKSWTGVFPVKIEASPYKPSTSGERDVREYQPEELPDISEAERIKNLEKIRAFSQKIG